MRFRWYVSPGSVLLKSFPWKLRGRDGVVFHHKNRKSNLQSTPPLNCTLISGILSDSSLFMCYCGIWVIFFELKLCLKSTLIRTELNWPFFYFVSLIPPISWTFSDLFQHSCRRLSLFWVSLCSSLIGYIWK